MHTFIQHTKAGQKPASESNGFHRNEVAPQLPGANTGDTRETLTHAGFTHSGYDFSRLPIYSKLPHIQAKPMPHALGLTFHQEADQDAGAGMIPQAYLDAGSKPSADYRAASQSGTPGQMVMPATSINQALAGPGKPLEPELRRNMEHHFGHNFFQVRVHAGAAAHHSALALKASAYTVGHNIVFAKDQFAPAKQEGRRLLAHELAHVVQQGRGGKPVISLDGSGPLEEAADRAATKVTSGSEIATVSGAAAPSLMCDPDNRHGDFDDDDEEDVSPRENDKAATQQRNRERAVAGKQESKLTSAEAESRLRALENSYKEPGAKTRSLKTKAEDLSRFEKLLGLVEGIEIQKSKRKGAFDELQRTPSTTVGDPQTRHVAGGPQLPDQELRTGIDAYAEPDYTISRRGKDGSIERLHVNLKSDKIHMQTPGKARSTARAYVQQAFRNSRHLANGESIIISFARTPSKEVQEKMLDEFFKTEVKIKKETFKTEVISEVRFGTTTYTRSDYNKKRNSPAGATQAPSGTAPAPGTSLPTGAVSPAGVLESTAAATGREVTVTHPVGPGGNAPLKTEPITTHGGPSAPANEPLTTSRMGGSVEAIHTPAAGFAARGAAMEFGAQYFLSTVLSNMRETEQSKAIDELKKLGPRIEEYHNQGYGVTVTMIVEVPKQVDIAAFVTDTGDAGQIVNFIRMFISSAVRAGKSGASSTQPPSISANLAKGDPEARDPREMTLDQQIRAQTGEEFPVKKDQPTPGFKYATSSLFIPAFDTREKTDEQPGRQTAPFPAVAGTYTIKLEKMFSGSVYNIPVMMMRQLRIDQVPGARPIPVMWDMSGPYSYQPYAVNKEATVEGRFTKDKRSSLQPGDIISRLEFYPDKNLILEWAKGLDAGLNVELDALYSWRKT